jgi:hypothetical protein
MCYFGPVSSFFDILTFQFLWFVMGVQTPDQQPTFKLHRVLVIFRQTRDRKQKSKEKPEPEGTKDPLCGLSSFCHFLLFILSNFLWCILFSWIRTTTAEQQYQSSLCRPFVLLSLSAFYSVRFSFHGYSTTAIIFHFFYLFLKAPQNSLSCIFTSVLQSFDVKVNNMLGGVTEIEQKLFVSIVFVNYFLPFSLSMSLSLEVPREKREAFGARKAECMIDEQEVRKRMRIEQAKDYILFCPSSVSCHSLFSFLTFCLLFSLFCLLYLLGVVFILGLSSQCARKQSWFSASALIKLSFSTALEW